MAEGTSCAKAGGPLPTRVLRPRGSVIVSMPVSQQAQGDVLLEVAPGRG